jgi:hypothetical protein
MHVRRTMGNKSLPLDPVLASNREPHAEPCGQACLDLRCFNLHDYGNTVLWVLVQTFP